jgi:hypothetical protein
MILEPPDSVQKLQAALQAKAKGSPGYRFYLLYDKLYRRDVLNYAYRCCKANGGAPGVDQQDFADIEAYGEERWLGELADKLHRKTYRAEAVRRVWIPKSDGRKRPLGIPCIVDRTVMTAAVLVLTPIFEADMPAEQHAYRANFSAHTAVRSVHSLINTGHTKIIEGDLAGYFDSLPHAELLKSVARRVSDRHLLHLIKMWLDAPEVKRRLWTDVPQQGHLGSPLAIRRSREKAMVAIEVGTCRCMGARSARAEAFGYGRHLESSGVLFTAQSLAHKKAVGGDAQTRVMVKAAPVAALIMM